MGESGALPLWYFNQLKAFHSVEDSALVASQLPENASYGTVSRVPFHFRMRPNDIQAP